MKITGAEVVVKVLLENGVDTVFGYPGGTILNVYDELYKHQDEINHILVAHEQGASFAADGYARATGKTGVAIATSGPGATNLVTGIATAFLDSIPTVFITANVGASLIGRDAFQEVCITGITLPITKHNYFVNDKDDLVDALRNAFRIANEGRKGPVLVDITKDVTAALIDYEPAEPYEIKPTTEPVFEEKIIEFANMINEARKPLILVGGGVNLSGAPEDVLQLSKKSDIPVVSTLMGLGALDSEERTYFGMIGMHGTYAGNKAVSQSDLILALGTRFSDRVALKPDEFAPKAKILQVDLEMSEINKNVKVHDYILGDCKEVTTRLLPYIEERKRDEWIEQLRTWNKDVPRHFKTRGNEMNPEEILCYISEHTDKETFYATDVGQHQMWTAQYLPQTTPRHFLSSGGLGAMGYGYGAAIGAQVGNPDKRVIHITGDGSLHMNLNEATTAVTYNLPIITVIMNNSVLGMVYQWQTAFYGKRYSHTLLEKRTNFVKIIEGFGGHGFSASNMDEFADAFEKALKLEGPVWIDCDISESSKVLPMIPNGKTVDDIILE